MKNKGIILLLVLALGVASIVFLSRTGEKKQSESTVAGSAAPDFELKDMAGKTWKLSDFRGKVLLLNFWATWCGSCQEENPSVQRFINAQKSDKLAFVSVLYNDDPSRAQAYMKSNGFSFPVLIDTVNLAAKYGITGVPETFIIDKKGTLKDRVIGPMQWDSPEVMAALAKLVNE